MRKLTTQEFINRARTVHGYRYGYAFSVYQSAHEKLFIHCKEHGFFEQSYANHISGKGCPSCGVNSQKITREEFIERANKTHGSRYNYDSVIYVNNATKVDIICREHGCFSQTPDNHVRGQGCPSCGIVSQKLTSEEFIEKSRKIHGYKYDYSSVKYRHSHQKVSICCPDHGVFEQKAANHLNGQECPGCANHGFDRTSTGFLYILRSDCGRYMKIGITHNPKQRHAQLVRVTPFSFKCIELIKGTGNNIANLEKELLAKYQQIGFTETFNGSTEWCLWDSSIVNQIKQEKFKHGKN